MPVVIRYHLDQHVNSAVARALRLRGLDVSTTAEAGLQDADDEKHIEYALAEKRVIFTQDKDFLGHHSRGVEHAGIAYAKQGTCSLGEIISHLELIAACLEDSEMLGKVEYL